MAYHLPGKKSRSPLGKDTAPAGGRARREAKGKAVASGLEAAALEAQRGRTQPPIPSVVDGSLPPLPIQQPFQPQSIDAARAESANPLQASLAGPFNPLQNAVDFAPQGGAPFNPLQHAIDTAGGGAAPPMVPPGMLGNPLQAAVDAAGPPAPTPTPRPDPTVTSGIPTPTPSPGGGGGAASPFGWGNTANVGPDAFGFAGPWGAGMPIDPNDPRAALAQAMQHQQAFGNDRANSAGYTTSGPGSPGGRSSAIFGGRGR